VSAYSTSRPSSQSTPHGKELNNPTRGGDGFPGGGGYGHGHGRGKESPGMGHGAGVGPAGPLYSLGTKSGGLGRK